MDTTVCIKKEIDIDIDVRIDTLTCEDCGEELNGSIKTDNFGDIQITVERCTCEDIAMQHGESK
jgi:hypothetical protein